MKCTYTVVKAYFIRGRGRDNDDFLMMMILSELLLSITYTILLTSFGYIIPALNSIKAIIQQDSDAYRQWVTFWCISCILSPATLALHPLVHLLVLLWLSLPRYQGATVLYNLVFLPYYHKYESELDEKIELTRGRMAKNVAEFIQGRGANFVGFVKSSVQQPLLKHSVASAATKVILAESNASSSSNCISEIAKPQEVAWDPQHSLRGALSTPMKQDCITSKDEDSISYVSDFLSILSRGLYVFAKIRRGGSKNEREKFDLRIFAIDIAKQCVVVASIDSNRYVADDECIPFAQISGFEKSGTQKIALIMSKSRNVLKTVNSCEIVLADSNDCETLLQGLNTVLPVLSAMIS